MTINTTPVKISTREKKKEIKEVGPTQENEMHRFTLKELEEKKYHFLDSDVSNMLEDLLQTKVVKLPECKCLEGMGHCRPPYGARFSCSLFCQVSQFHKATC